MNKTFKAFQRLCSTSKAWIIDTKGKESTILTIKRVKDQHKLQYPLVWLRDNCQCPKCFDQTSKSRILDQQTNLKVKPSTVQLENIDREPNKRQPRNRIRCTSTERTVSKTIISNENTSQETKQSQHNNSLNNTPSYNAGSDQISPVLFGHKDPPMSIATDKESPVANDAVNYSLNITWEDGHHSDFTLDWLVTRSFNADNRRKLNQVYKMEQVPWTAHEFETICSRFNYADIMSNETTLLSWLQCLATYGVAIVENAGQQIGALRELASRVGFLKRTQYGETFRVEAKPGSYMFMVCHHSRYCLRSTLLNFRDLTGTDVFNVIGTQACKNGFSLLGSECMFQHVIDTSNVAYLSSRLQLHTDLPYYEYKPGLNLLHCVVQSQARGDGMNQLTDALAVCQHLSAKESRVFDILSRTLVNWADYGEDDRYRFANIHRAPVICLDAEGRIIRINYSQPQRDSVFNVPLAEVQPWYEAMARFTELLYHPKYMVELKVQPGDILTFDNIRLVHGRSGYDGERLLEGGYLDWDLVRSRIRVLREELGKTMKADI